MVARGQTWYSSSERATLPAQGGTDGSTDKISNRKMLEVRNNVAMKSNGRGVAGEDIQCKGACCVAVGSEQRTP
jgi:hypothetical protein